MPYIPDFNDKIEISELQYDSLFQLNWQNYLFPIPEEEFIKQQLKIVPNSDGYTLMLFSKKMVKNVKI